MKRYIRLNEEDTKLLGNDFINVWNTIYNLIEENGGINRSVLKYMQEVVEQGIMSEADVQAIKNDALETYYNT